MKKIGNFALAFFIVVMAIGVACSSEDASPLEIVNQEAGPGGLGISPTPDPNPGFDYQCHFSYPCRDSTAVPRDPIIVPIEPFELKQFNLVCHTDTMRFWASEGGLDFGPGFIRYEWSLGPNVQFVNGSSKSCKTIDVAMTNQGDGFWVMLTSFWCNDSTRSVVYGANAWDCDETNGPDI